MRPAGMQNRVMTILEQMQSGLVQSPHWPLTAQGGLILNRWALAGAATLRARAMAALCGN